MIYAAGISHETVESAELGKYGLAGDKCSEAESGVLAAGIADEMLLLSTCNRVEMYLVSVDAEAAGKAAKAVYGANGGEFVSLGKVAEGEDAIEHIFSVASGLKSQMTGETEILGQVKAAYERARGAGHCGPVLNTVFQKAIHCAKWVRTNTEIGRGKISVGSVCAELALRIFEDIGKAKILLIGSGEVGKLVSDALYVRGGLDISVCSRTRANADALAAKIGCASADMEDALGGLWRYDIVLCASLSKEPIIRRGMVESAVSRRGGRPIFLIDLAVPRNIEESCAEIEDAYMYNLKDLSDIANENIEARRAQIERAGDAVKSRAVALWDRLRNKA